MKKTLQKLTCLMITFLALGCSQASIFDNSSADSSKSSSPKSSETSGSGAASNSSSSTQPEPYSPAVPILKFTATDISFATTATKSDLTRPKVSGKFSLSNCDSKYAFTNVEGTMKVRGNQTAGWRKKGFKIKFSSSRNMLGLNHGYTYKEWILLADAKDTTLVRTALGLYVAKGICEDEEQIWVSDYTPVTVYLNDQYWGFYYLAEQKEVNAGRVNLAKPKDNYEGVDIGYCFELDHYADSAGAPDEASEMKKGADGDPTFRMKYSPSMQQGSPSGPLATGRVCTYTMLSEITDGPSDEHVQADYSSVDQNSGVPNSNAIKTSNSNQLSFIRARMEALYQVLYYATKGQAKEITNDNEVIAATDNKTAQQVMAQYFDLDSWVDGYILNAFSIAPDLGYSSFYMSYDNTPTGDHKLRYDVPWDFDSNFGNRRQFYVNAEGDEYVNNTYNTWLYSLSKLSFFKDMVKAKWNKIREAKLFENMFTMLNNHFKDHDGEIRKNHEKWPENDAAHTRVNGQPVYYNNFDELRDPYKEPSQYKEAEAETISWCAKRVNYLEKQWGNNRPNISTGA